MTSCRAVRKLGDEVEGDEVEGTDKDATDYRVQAVDDVSKRLPDLFLLLHKSRHALVSKLQWKVDGILKVAGRPVPRVGRKYSNAWWSAPTEDVLGMMCITTLWQWS